MASTTAENSHTISNWNFGADAAGVDVKLFGDTASAYMLWDASDNKLEFAGVGGMKIGTLSSTTPGSGLTLDSTTTRVIEVNADDNNVAMGSAVTARCIDGRFMNYNSPKAESWGIQGKCKIGTLARTANVAAGVVGAFESTGTCSTATGSGNTYCAGVMGRLGGGGTFTIGSGTQVAGVLAFYNTSVTNAFTNTGTCAFLAVASEIAGVGNWDYGLYFEDVVRGGYITSELSGSSALNSFEHVVADATTNSSGYTRGIYVNATVSGTKTGSGEWNGLGSDFTVSGDTPYVYGMSIWGTHSGNPTLGFVAPISIYLEDMGSACGAIVGIDVGLAGGSNSPAGRHAFMRFRNHSAGAVPDTVFQMEGAGAADYLLAIDTASGFTAADTSSLPGNAIYKLKCRVGSTDFYLIGVADF